MLCPARAAWLLLLLLAAQARELTACRTDDDCTDHGALWCDGAPHCNARVNACEVVPRCVDPARPYCDAERRACLSTKPRARPPPPRSMLAVERETPCTTNACCIEHVRASYRSGAQLPWCIRTAHVDASGSGCTLVPRCASGMECDAVARRCYKPVVAVAQLVCTDSSECDDGVFCNGDERCESSVCAAATEPRCAANASAPQCDEAQRACVPSAATAATSLVVWIFALVVVIIVAFLLCGLVFCALNPRARYDATERAAAGNPVLYDVNSAVATRSASRFAAKPGTRVAMLRRADRL